MRTLTSPCSGILRSPNSAHASVSIERLIKTSFAPLSTSLDSWWTSKRYSGISFGSAVKRPPLVTWPGPAAPGVLRPPPTAPVSAPSSSSPAEWEEEGRARGGEQRARCARNAIGERKERRRRNKGTGTGKERKGRKGARRRFEYKGSQRERESARGGEAQRRARNTHSGTPSLAPRFAAYQCRGVSQRCGSPAA